MAPKRAPGYRTKKAAGLAQPTLAFSQRKPGKSDGKLKSTTSTTSIPSPVHRQDSTTSIDLSEEATSNTVKAEKKETGKEGDERKRLNVKSKEWAGVYADAKIAMGGMEPIHAGTNTHNQVHHILRVFDMTSKYGPSVGVSRLQRWERAKKWGLNPPPEIHSILTTKEGEDEVAYRENVLHAWL